MERLRATALTGLTWSLFFLGSLVSTGEAATNEISAVGQKFLNVGGNVYTKNLREIDRHGWGAYLSLRLSASLYQFETFDELLDFSRDRISSLEVRPAIEFEWPVRFVDHVYFITRQEVGLIQELWTESEYLASVTALKLKYFQPGKFEDLQVTTGIEYGTRYAEDFINVNDHVSLSLEATTKHYLGAQVGKYKLIASPYFKTTYYLRQLEYRTPEGGQFDVETRYEIGAKFSSDPRYRFWKLKMPRLRITYDFSGDFKGIRIKIGS